MIFGLSNISNASWFRARLLAIRKLIVELPTERDEKNPDRTLVRNGVIPLSQQQRFEEIFDYEYKLSFALNEPLSFTELTIFNTWFIMHPEKVCGQEVITTSREFPIAIKGSKELIIETISKGIKETPDVTVPDVDITQSRQDTDNIEPEQEQEIKRNRFGNPADALLMTVQEFNAFYYDNYIVLTKIQKPGEDKIESLKKQLKDKTLTASARKQTKGKLEDLILIRNLQLQNFENDWTDFTKQIHDLIIEIARTKGIDIDEAEDYNVSDDIMLAITERPGIEQYWNTKVIDVINAELEYYYNESQPEDDFIRILALEALALETELKLLKI